MNAHVAMVGLGHMGSAMSLRLLDAGYRVHGWDLSADARRRAASQGVRIGTDLRAALAGCAIVLTSLPDGEAVRAAWTGAGGVCEQAEAASTCIELSTIEPEVMREVAQAATARGLRVIDCPVSGGPLEARAGQLVLMAGGEPGAIEAVRPVLDALGSALHPTGPVGTAKVVKIVNNMMAMGNLLVACEAFALGLKAGVDAERLFAVLAESGGRSQTFLKRFPFALRGDFEPRFRMDLGEKDLTLGLGLARAQGAPSPAAGLVHELFGQAVLEGHGGKDVVALFSMYRDWGARLAARST